MFSGLAQSPSSLYFNERQRLPGLKVGQIYSYPAKRWRKKRRQYLSNYNSVPIKRKDDSDSNDFSATVPTSSVENPSVVSNNNEDSKDSIGIKDQESTTSKVSILCYLFLILHSCFFFYFSTNFGYILELNH